jgi:DNA-binding transcriptional ArsR family regulator
MVEYSAASLDQVFAALADPTRRVILEQLRDGPAKVTQIARPFSVSLNAISKHIMVLERAGLVQREVQGREHHCRLVAEPLRPAQAWLDHYRNFWETRFDALEQHIENRRKQRKH